MLLITFQLLMFLYRSALSVNPYADDFVKSNIVRQMLKTPALKLVQKGHSDPFEFLEDKYPLPKGIHGPFQQYDFVIIGGGSAGSVIANRLSGHRSRPTVLLLEAGRPENLFTDIPMLAPFLQSTGYTWPYLAERQDGVCLAMEDQRCFWPRGRALGGTSVINYMIYTRGRPQDWDRIAADGNYGWSYADVLPYFMKSERAELKKMNASYHGTTGELYVQDVPFRSKLSKAFVDAGKFMGYREVDYNSPDGFGFGYIQANQRNGHRFSAAKAFLHGIKKRKNLHILTESLVTEILLDRSNQAYGVVFTKNGYQYQIYAKNEVILSAGPIASPHLLMLSGIGPREQLEPLGIPVRSPLQVGQRVFDHISLVGITFTLNTSRIAILDRDFLNSDNIMKWLQFGEGPLTSLGGAENIAYIKTKVSREPGDFPDIELIGTCGSYASDRGLATRKGIKMTDAFYNRVYKPLEGTDAFVIIPMLLHPKSFGYYKLRSKNPVNGLEIHANYLTEREDVDTFIAAIKFIIELVKTPPYQKYGAKLYTKHFPHCTDFQFGTDAYWECSLRSLTNTLHHQVGSCKMGPPEDPFAIVDPELRVYGVRRLRVADSSIIPKPTSAHTNAPAIMIGEKASDIILNTWYPY